MTYGDPNLNHPRPGQYGPPQATNWIAQAQTDGTRQSYAKAFLQALGAPLSQNNVALLESIMANEGTTARYNPMASTWDAPGATSMNSVGVRNYADVASAIAAQVTQWNRVFPRIVQGLMSDNAASVLGDSEWNSYSGNSSGSYQQKLAAHFRQFSGDPNAGAGLVGTTASGSGGMSNGPGTPANSAAILAQWGWLIDDPEVGPLIRRAESNGMTQDEFTQQLQQTHWYRTHSDTSRQWLALWNEDPSSARQQLAEKALEIRSTAQELGINLPDVTLAALGYQASQYGWTTQQMTMAIFGAFKVNANMGGGFGAGVTSARQTAADYGIRLSDSAATNYETQIAEGLIDPQTLQGNFQKQAEALFPTVAPLLQQGQTVRSIIEPYMQNAATTLGVDASGFDPTDPKWLAPLQAKDGKGNPTQLSLSDWSTKVMSDPTYGFDQTDNARNAAFNLGASFAQTFGVSA